MSGQNLKIEREEIRSLYLIYDYFHQLLEDNNVMPYPIISSKEESEKCKFYYNQCVNCYLEWIKFKKDRNLDSLIHFLDTYSIKKDKHIVFDKKCFQLSTIKDWFDLSTDNVPFGLPDHTIIKLELITTVKDESSENIIVFKGFYHTMEESYLSVASYALLAFEKQLDRYNKLEDKSLMYKTFPILEKIYAYQLMVITMIHNFVECFVYSLINQLEYENPDKIEDIKKINDEFVFVKKINSLLAITNPKATPISKDNFKDFSESRDDRNLIVHYDPNKDINPKLSLEQAKDKVDKAFNSCLSISKYIWTKSKKTEKLPGFGYLPMLDRSVLIERAKRFYEDKI